MWLWLVHALGMGGGGAAVIDQGRLLLEDGVWYILLEDGYRIRLESHDLDFVSTSKRFIQRSPSRTDTLRLIAASQADVLVGAQCTSVAATPDE